MSEESISLGKVLGLIKQFLEKVPFKNYSKNIDRLNNKIKNLNDIDSESDQTERYKSIIKSFKNLLRRELHQKVFFIVGGHGGIIIDNTPFCEFDSPEYAISKLLKKMETANNLKIPFNLEIAIYCLKWLKNHYTDKFKEFKRLIKQGNFEIINPTYSQPYLLMLGEESNIKQFKMGLNTLKELDLNSNMYYASEFSVHPQLPQLLKSLGIIQTSIRSRLLGCGPTSNSAVINWIGLDGTVIDALVNQHGIYDGEYFHGMFYQEIPNLLFQLISKPYMNYALFSNLEDFIMPQPMQEEIWRLNLYSELFGKFTLSSEIFGLIPKEGRYKYARDEFLMGDYVFYTPKLLLQNNRTEVLLILAEILNCLTKTHLSTKAIDQLDELWETLLVTQAHDSYAVPFIRTGDYSRTQLSDEEQKKTAIVEGKISISDLSIGLLEKLQNKLHDLIKSSLNDLVNIGTERNNDLKPPYQFIIVFNPSLYKRKDITVVKCNLSDHQNYNVFNGQKLIPCKYSNNQLSFIAEIPTLQYKVFSIVRDKTDLSIDNNQFLYDVCISHESNKIDIKHKNTKVFTLDFRSDVPYKISLDLEEVNYILKREIISITTRNSKSKLEFCQYTRVNRLECKLSSNGVKGLILHPEINVERPYINYPFGIEETYRTKIHSLDFVWLKGDPNGILYIHRNSPQFEIKTSPSEITNIFHKPGCYEFAFCITEENDFASIRKLTDAYKYKFIGLSSKEPLTLRNKEKNLLSIEPYIPVLNLWRRDEFNYIRLFNPSHEIKETSISGTLIRQPIEEISLEGKIISVISGNKVKLQPWQIKTFRF